MPSREDIIAKTEALQRLSDKYKKPEIANKVDEAVKPVKQAADTFVNDYMSRPNAAMKEAAMEGMKEDGSVLEGIKRGLTNPASQAPSGFDVASRVQDKYDFNNPTALAGLATLADVADPSMAITKGAGLGKAAVMTTGANKIRQIGKMTKQADKMYDIGGVPMRAKNMADAMRKRELMSKTGIIKNNAPINSLDANSNINMPINDPSAIFHKKR